MSQSQSFRKYHFQLPIAPDTIKSLKVGDQIYLSGIICSGRDHFHKRILSYVNQNKSFPPTFDLLRGSAIYHMGPIIKKIDSQAPEYEIVAGGPTTSARMDQFQEKVCKILKVTFVIGKGGMQGIKWDDIPAVYLQYPGGTGALTTKFIKKIIAVEWLDLGSPEAAWFLEVENFGPLIVGIDTHGNTLYR